MSRKLLVGEIRGFGYFPVRGISGVIMNFCGRKIYISPKGTDPSTRVYLETPDRRRLWQEVPPGDKKA